MSSERTKSGDRLADFEPLILRASCWLLTARRQSVVDHAFPSSAMPAMIPLLAEHSFDIQNATPGQRWIASGMDNRRPGRQAVHCPLSSSGQSAHQDFLSLATSRAGDRALHRPLRSRGTVPRRHRDDARVVPRCTELSMTRCRFAIEIIQEVSHVGSPEHTPY